MYKGFNKRKSMVCVWVGEEVQIVGRSYRLQILFIVYIRLVVRGSFRIEVQGFRFGLYNLRILSIWIFRDKDQIFGERMEDRGFVCVLEVWFVLEVSRVSTVSIEQWFGFQGLGVLLYFQGFYFLFVRGGVQIWIFLIYILELFSNESF